MQRTTWVVIAIVLGLGVGVSAGFLAARSPSGDSVMEPVVSTDPAPSPSITDSTPDGFEPSKSDRDRPRRNQLESEVAPSNPSSIEPTPLAFDAQATHCPENGGGGDLISLYMTDAHLVYICQGGAGRADWRELDYYAVNRSQPDDWIRLRAFVTSGPGVYAENGAYRYEIDPTSLTVRENSSILLQEPVLRCKGNCS